MTSPTDPESGRTERGKSVFVALTYKHDSSFTPQMAKYWGEQIQATEFWTMPGKVIAKIHLDRLATATDARHLELAKLVASWLREQVKRIGGTLPDPAFDPVNLDGAVCISATEGKLKADDLPGFKPSVAIPFTRGRDMRKVPPRKPFVFQGTVRREDVAATVAKSKHKKSFLVSQASVCFAGKVRLLGLEPGEGRVLLVDLELHPEDTIARLHKQAASLGLKWSDLEDRIDVINLRGIPIDIFGLRDFILDDLANEHYALIVIDTLYRLLPKGVSENDANGITGVLNVVAEIGREKNAAVEIVAHAPKGDTTNRAIEDLTSGTGAFGRFIDAQWGLYPHQEPGCMVLKTMLRADKTPPDVVIRFDEEGMIFVLEPGLSPRALATRANRPDLSVDDLCKNLTHDWGKKTVFITEMQAKLAAGENLVKKLIEAGIKDGRLEVQPARGPHPAMIRLKSKKGKAA